MSTSECAQRQPSLRVLYAHLLREMRADTLTVMRRWLSIFLLILLPHQFSWAAVVTYCEHESGTQAMHFGHHQHKHTQPAGESSEVTKGKSSGTLGGAECHSHSQCSADLPVVPVMQMLVCTQPFTEWEVAVNVAPVLDRPERPQWVDHA